MYIKKYLEKRMNELSRIEKKRIIISFIDNSLRLFNLRKNEKKNTVRSIVETFTYTNL